MKIVREHINFERSGDIKSQMDIGRKATLQRMNNGIEWDWYPDQEDDEEILDIFEYKGFNVKVSKLSDDSGSAYIAIADTGEPYLDDPVFSKDPDTAIRVMKNTLDDWER